MPMMIRSIIFQTTCKRVQKL